MPTEFSEIRETLSRNGLSFQDVDTILVKQETYDELREGALKSSETSNYMTANAPAIRVTAGREKIVHVNSSGYREEYDI